MTSVPTVEVVTSVQPVIGQDSLGPLPQGTTPAMSFDAVLIKLHQDPSYAKYVADPARLTVKLGLYTFTWYQGVQRSVLAYVATGQVPSGCAAGHGPPPEARAVTAARTTPPSGNVACSATVVVNADSGDVIVVQERGATSQPS